LAQELRDLDASLANLTKRAGQRLLGQFGVGPQTAATLLVTAGVNPERLYSEAAMAALCGASPLQASSGKNDQHRLNRGAIVRQITHSGRSPSFVCVVNHELILTLPEERQRDFPQSKFSAGSNAT
jgi:transposase